VPRDPNDLQKHEVILDLNRSDPQVWTFGKGAKLAQIKVSGRLRFGNPYMCVAAARAGFGIASAPAFAAAEDLRQGRVVTVLQKYEPDPIAVYIVYPHARHLASKVRVFVDFLAQRFAGEPEWHRDWE
jgi:DNA-binding transcriptional LysR family regulator